MAHRTLQALVADLQALPASPIRRRIRNFLLRLGDPVIERAGVVNRRVMWVHEFPEHWPDGQRTLEFDKDRDGDPEISLTVQLGPIPTKWRP